MSHFSQQSDQFDRLECLVDAQKHRILQAIKDGADPIDIARTPVDFVDPNFGFYYGVISRRMRHESFRGTQLPETVDEARMRTLVSLGAFAQQFSGDAIILPFPTMQVESADQYIEPIAMGN